MPHGFSREGRECRRGNRAFSLAELMIALVILGLGLLFIAAALPVGLEYTRQTVDLATGDATGEYALDLLEANLRTSRRLHDVDIQATTTLHYRLDNIHRPRYKPAVFPDQWALRETYEPIFKVRPLALGNIAMSAVNNGEPARGSELVDDAEGAIGAYLNQFRGVWTHNSMPWDAQNLRYEYDFGFYGTGFDPLLSLVIHPVLDGTARIYPPIEPVTTFTVANFFTLSDYTYPTYDARYRHPPVDNLSLCREREKAVDHRVAWTAFYRRVSYRGNAGANGVWYTPDDVADEPLLYELIVVVTRRPTTNHRFPRQDLSGTGPAVFDSPTAMAPNLTNDLVGTDRLAPTPWLVTFDTALTLPPTPALLLNTDYVRINANTENEERVILNTYTDPPTLSFLCKPAVGALLPVGSVIIPAVNDQRYVPPTDVGGLVQLVGFVPSARESLPVYEVVERPDPTTVVVKNNGYYPWLRSPALNASHFPVWVIPPAFVERDSTGQPVYERASPILKVIRRTVSLREIQR